MIHAIERARQRYAVSFSEGDLIAIAWLIRTRKPGDRRVKLYSKHKEIYDIRYKGRWLRVAMSPDLQKVMTLQPRPGFTLGQAAPELGEVSG